MLQTVLPQRENAGNANITVIHVPDVSSNSSCRRRSSWRRRCVGRHSGSNRLKSTRCANCSQKLNEKKCQKEARFCTQFRLLRRRNFQRLACLECCVNRHNGHQLVTLDELEYEHQKLINDLHILSGNIRTLRRECEADLKFALSVLENAGTTPLPPAVLQRMRQHQYHNSARLHKLLHFIEVFLCVFAYI
ncbi:unnamed protein product [Gongylonema pulchrum]|uniref:Uncharacterized protein n=1 Tax=Gongylonema pulchrum TaxID=637853 RepID=A0A183DVQ8_9BILA|nr:unnamed protein product [Gongylonema pulchrum]